MLSYTKSRKAGKTFLQILFFVFLVTQICFAQWVQTNLPDSVTVRCFALNGTNIFAGTDGNGVFFSNNNGISWTQAGLKDTSIYCLTVSGSNLFAGAGVWRNTDSGLYATHSCFLSTDNGTNWVEVNSGFPANTEVISLIVSDTNIFAGTYGNGVYLSTNNGLSWSAVCSGLTNTRIKCLATTDAYVFAGTDSGVFLSTNYGSSWAEANYDLANLIIEGLTITDTNVFAGTWGGGVWRRPLSEMVPVELISFTASANGKEVTLNWSTATELNNQGFEVQRKFASNDFLTVGSVKGHGTTTSPNDYSFVDKLFDAGKYFYRLKQIDYGGKYEYSQTVEVNWSPFISYKLEQNYPNPFNPTTTIGFGIPASPNPSDLSRRGKASTEGGAFVTLKVYDILGNEVKTLVNKEMEAGYHSVDFNASELPSGVYFYQLRTSSFTETKKMLLLR